VIGGLGGQGGVRGWGMGDIGARVWRGLSRLGCGFLGSCS